MLDAIEIAGSALRANQTWLNAISNNVANMQTVGFKKTSLQFSNMVQSDGKLPVASGGRVSAAGAGVRIGNDTIEFTNGDVRATNQPLDIAILGVGFFEVILPGGESGLTRIGALKIDADGRLMTRSGLNLQQEIRIPPDVEAIEINSDGRIKGKLANSLEIIDLGELQLARVSQPEYLKNEGDGLFSVTDLSGEINSFKPGESGAGTLMQGHLEMSNVDLVEEMSNLVIAQRAYQLNARVLQTSDQLLETINNLRR